MARTSSRSERLRLLLLAAFLPGAIAAQGFTHLLYLEAQGVGGYSSLQDKPIFYSTSPEAEMQKPSVGFDYLARFSGAGGDWGSLAAQGRFALTVDEDWTKQGEGQLYNAWFKVKTPLSDVWAGHNRPAFGLGSTLDSHALLLRTLAIQGFGYDRDWGLGTYRDFSRGNLALSATAGSGMPVYSRGNYMLAGRAAYGVLNQDNYTIGVSGAGGKTLDTMGYDLREPDPLDMGLFGADFAFLWNRLENRADFLTGTWLDQDTTAVMYRLGYIVDAEERVKIEAQPTYWTNGGGNWLLGACVTARLTSDLTFRTMVEYDRDQDDHRVIGQLYYYKRL